MFFSDSFFFSLSFASGATIGAVYRTAHFTMPRYAAFLWGAGQGFLGFLVSYSRVLATL